MERDIKRQQAESLVRQITEERERFVSAWQQGARTPELNQIRENIRQLNELLWNATIPGNPPQGTRLTEPVRSFSDRSAGWNNRP